MNIVLIGFMGTGKSTVSDYLHTAYDMETADTDQMIEEREGKSISAIFSENGEEYFRNLETELLMELQARENTVISCGGGAALRERNVQEMKKIGKIVLLSASPEVILQRVSENDDRPLLRGNKNVEFISQMMEQRRGKYEAAADLTIDTGSRTIEEVCTEIMKQADKKRLILASGSPRRKEIMEQAGLDFDIMVSRKEEVYQSTEPEEIVKELSLMKAEDIAEQIRQRNVTVIGADTVVAHRGRILGKPKDEAEAFAMIHSIQGESHDVYTGVAVISYDEHGNRTVVNHAVGTKVFVNPMTHDEIRAYLATREYEDKAGSYAIQGRFAPYIEKIEGDYYNVVGLPISYIYRVLPK